MRKLKKQWMKLAEAVYENKHGFCVHTGGLAKIDGVSLWVFNTPQWRIAYNLQPNHKRRVLQWAELISEV